MTPPESFAPLDLVWVLVRSNTRGTIRGKRRWRWQTLVAVTLCAEGTPLGLCPKNPAAEKG